MDPDSALLEIAHTLAILQGGYLHQKVEEGYRQELADSLEGLAGWLLKGGAIPQKFSLKIEKL